MPRFGVGQWLSHGCIICTLAVRAETKPDTVYFSWVI